MVMGITNVWRLPREEPANIRSPSESPQPAQLQEQFPPEKEVE
jgi:hypothetical protein